MSYRPGMGGKLLVDIPEPIMRLANTELIFLKRLTAHCKKSAIV